VCRPSCAVLDLDDSFREARCGQCAAVFHVCRRCDRWQIYCGDSCSGVGGRASRRAAARRYQASLAGRRDHAARQAAYRARQKVTHQGIQEVDAAGSLDVRADRTAAMTAGVSISTVSVPNVETTLGVQAVVGDDAALPDLRWGRAAASGAATARGAASHCSVDPAGGVVAVVAAPAVRCAEGTSSALGLCDGFGIGRETLHYEVEVFDPRRRRRGLGSFGDLRQLSLRGGR
jgi:hypothetical protein